MSSSPPTQHKDTGWIVDALAVFVFWRWWDYRSLTLLYWMVGFCAVDFFFVKFAQRAMDNGRDKTRREWMLCSIAIKAFMVGLAISTFFWHPEAAQDLVVK